MSELWIKLGDAPPPHRDKPAFRLSGRGFEIWAFGTDKNIRAVGDERRGALALGIGVEAGRIWQDRDWKSALLENKFPKNGHYLIIRWADGAITVENDPLGLRDLFWAKVPGGIVASSRLDRVAVASRQNRINFENIGSLWLGPSILNWESPVDGIGRLGPGGRVKFEFGEISVSRPRLFEYPHGEPATPGEVLEVLESVVLAEPDTPRYLSLSGGLDSRGLLAILLGGNRQWRALTFGYEGEPDVLIVRDIARQLGFELLWWEIDFPDGDELWTLLRRHSAMKWITIPVSVAPALETLTRLASVDAVNIDGGLGEVLRQRVLRRLAPFPGIRLSSSLVARLIANPLPRIFTDEILAIMQRGFMRDIEAGLARTRGLSAEQIAEIWALWFRLPNFSGLEQARLDEFTVNFMPYVQPEVLEAGLKMPARERRKGAVHMLAMRRFAPRLMKFPLARFGRILPFAVGKNPYLMRLALPFLPDRQTPILRWAFRKMITPLKDRIFDLINSQDFRETPYYRHGFIEGAVEKYFAGDEGQVPVLNWFLTFELWRQSLG